jgi:hypothetical protein
MVDNAWNARYTKSVDNASRNFDMGGDNSYGLCNIFCNFDITKLDKKDYIKGINASSTDNFLHIDPTVDTEPPQKGLQAVGINTGTTTVRTKKVYITNYYFDENGKPQDYELMDIIIRNPSKVVLAGKRYPLEVCLIFISNDKIRYLVVCAPMNVSPINTTDDPLKKDLYEMLNIISNNFPTKGKTYSVENAPNWNPLIFFPIKTEDNASFYSWVDPKTDNTVKYIQFNNPDGALTVPNNFFNVFAKTLVNGVDIANEATKLPADPQNANLAIYFNQNKPITNITTRTIITQETIPQLQDMLDYSKEVEAKDAKQDVVCPVKCDTNCKINTVKYVLIGVGITFLIGFFIAIGIVFYRNRKQTIELPQIIQ